MAYPPGRPEEYSLTADGFPEEVRSRLSPWVAGFIGMGPKQAALRLKERWSEIERPSFRLLMETLLEFEVNSIADVEDGGKIRAVHCGGDDDFHWYLPDSMERTQIRDRLDGYGFEENELLVDFIHHFGGLAEDTQSCGHFLHREKWTQFTDSWSGKIEGFKKWKNSLKLYHAANGCWLLIGADGKLGWWWMAEQYVEDAGYDLDGMIPIYCTARKLDWPFDPYGPPDGEFTA
jgi:hypothetical protein